MNNRFTTLGEMIKNLRRFKTQKELSKQVGISEQYLCDIEKDRRIPSEKVLIKICKYIGVSFDYMNCLCGRTPSFLKNISIEDYGTIIKKLKEKK